MNIKELVHFDNLYRKPAVWQVSNRGVHQNWTLTND